MDTVLDHAVEEQGYHLLVIGDERDIVPRARELRPGLRTSILCTPQEAHKIARIAAHQRVVVLRDDAPLDDWVAAARFVHAVDPVHRAICYGEEGQEPTALIAADLGLPGHTPDTVRAVDDKRLMRERLAAAGVDETLSIEARSEEEITAFAERAGYPLICKPVRGVGSHGVVRLNGPDDIATALDRVRSGAAGLKSTAVIVEQFHTGEEFSVECMSENGVHLPLCITRKFLADGGFVETGHQLPALLDAQTERAVRESVGAALTALGVRDGASHTELIVTDQGTVRIVETHLRQGGDRIPYLLREARGLDIVTALARQSIGVPSLDELRERLDKPADGPSYAAIWYAMPGVQGEVAEVRGVDEARARPEVRDVVVRTAPGDRLTEIRASAHRPAHVWAVADTPEQALATVREAVAGLTFLVAVPGGAVPGDGVAGDVVPGGAA
ncbi:ATP-grasp domain-containing protein [Kitasatospora sp. NPDC001660]